MKRIYSYVFAAVAMFAAVSCQKENTIDAPEANEEAFAITAVANADTKTALVDGVKTYWTSTDALTVFDATASNRKFTTDITENSASAKFTTSTFVLPENLETAMLLAVYPYTEGATTDFSTAITGLELPATQQAVAGGFDSDATIAFALGGLADQHNLKFNNVYGLFEFVVNEDNVKEVAIRANGGEKIAGPVSLALNGTLVAAEGAVSEVTLEGDFVKGSTYYVALIPGTYASGITVSFDGEEVKSTSNEVVLEKNQIRGMGELSIPADWIMTGEIGSIDMVASDVYTDLYVAKNVTLGTGKSFKFQNKEKNKVVGAWGTSGTVDCNGQVNSWYGSDATASYAAQISVSTAGNYDVYFSPANLDFLIIKAGVEDMDSEWSMVGWIGSSDKWSYENGIKLKYNYVTTKHNLTRNISNSDYFLFVTKDWGTWIGSPGYERDSNNNRNTTHYTIANEESKTVNLHNSYDNEKAQFHMNNSGTYKIEIQIGEKYASSSVKFTKIS